MFNRKYSVTNMLIELGLPSFKTILVNSRTLMDLTDCNKKLSYRWQTAQRVKRSVKVTKHGTIPYVRYGFLL